MTNRKPAFNPFTFILVAALLSGTGTFAHIALDREAAPAPLAVHAAPEFHFDRGDASALQLDIEAQPPALVAAFKDPLSETPLLDQGALPKTALIVQDDADVASSLLDREVAPAAAFKREDPALETAARGLRAKDSALRAGAPPKDQPAAGAVSATPDLKPAAGLTTLAAAVPGGAARDAAAAFDRKLALSLLVEGALPETAAATKAATSLHFVRDAAPFTQIDLEHAHAAAFEGPHSESPLLDREALPKTALAVQDLYPRDDDVTSFQLDREVAPAAPFKVKDPLENAARGLRAQDSALAAAASPKDEPAAASATPDLKDTEHHARKLGTCPKQPFEHEPFKSKAELVSVILTYNTSPDVVKLIYGEISQWCVGEITDMSHLISNFNRPDLFNEDLSSWDVSRVTNFESMFSNTMYFNGNLTGWDVSRVTSFGSMFSGATIFCGDLSKWNVAKAMDMRSMFYGAEYFNSDISKWDVREESKNRLSYMFKNAQRFNQNLCPWGKDIFSSRDSTSFEGSNCPFKTQPGTFCHDCHDCHDCRTGNPSKSPLASPTTDRPSKSPSSSPATASPSKSPSASPTTTGPTSSPTSSPTTVPTESPSKSPATSIPTKSPSSSPTTAIPTKYPSLSPTTDIPTKSPTGSPTNKTPSMSPTKSSARTTSSPTSSTTTSPTTDRLSKFPSGAPWSIDFVELDVDFSLLSKHQISLKYDIGKDRAYESSLLQKDCVSSIEDVTVNSTVNKFNKNGTHDTITINHSVDKGAIAGSSIANAPSDQLEMCQLLKLILPGAASQPDMVISEDRRQVNIDFELSVNYSVANELGPGRTETAAGETNVSSFVQAFKCAGGSNFTRKPEALVPNAELHVCVRSVSPDVEIQQLKSMVVAQGAVNMTVVREGNVVISSIAGMTYAKPENGVVVATFIPTNIFTYVAGASINISGSIDMQLAGSERRLLANSFDRDTPNAVGGRKASYELSVDLQDELIATEEDNAWLDSSASVVGGVSALCGMTLLYLSEM